MVHRDIKPHNLMVTADGMLKILDFGLATLSPDVLVSVETTSPTSYLTAAGSIMGTPDFIAPEQAVNALQADIRSDIYSLGATLCKSSPELKRHAELRLWQFRPMASNCLSEPNALIIPVRSRIIALSGPRQ